MSESWEAILAKFELEGDNPRPTTPEEIKRCEQKLDVSLPNSYKDYCLVFGPGVLAEGCYRIVAPGEEAWHERTEIVKFQAVYKESNVFEGLDGPNEAILRRGIFFAENLEDAFFWDPQDITNREDSEYGIYVFYECGDVERLSDTFLQFFQDYIVENKTLKYEEPCDVELTFEPFG